MIQNLISQITESPINMLITLGVILAIFGVISFIFGVVKKLVWVAFVILGISLVLKFLSSQSFGP